MHPREVVPRRLAGVPTRDLTTTSRDFRRLALFSVRVTCRPESSSASRARSLTRRAARTTRYGRARWAPPRFSVCTGRCRGALASSQTTTSESASASSDLPPRRARSRRGTLNRARDAQRRVADARLLSLSSAGTPSVSFATSSTRTRVWRVRTRRRRSPGPRRTRSSSSARPRCTSSSAASRGASSTPSAGNLEGRRSASHRRPERTLDPSTRARPYP